MHSGGADGHNLVMLSDFESSLSDPASLSPAHLRELARAQRPSLTPLILAVVKALLLAGPDHRTDSGEAKLLSPADFAAVCRHLPSFGMPSKV